MPEINPFDLLKIGNDPSLQQSVSDSSSLLRTGLGQILANRGGLDRQRLQNIGGLDTAAIKAGFGGIEELRGASSERELSRRLMQALTGGQAISAAAGGGVRIPKGASFTLPDVGSQLFDPGQLLRGEAQAEAAGKVQAELQNTIKRGGVRDTATGAPVGTLETFEETRKRTLSGEGKGGLVNEQTAQTIIQEVKRQFGLDAVVTDFTEDEQFIRFKVDGKPKRVAK